MCRNAVSSWRNLNEPAFHVNLSDSRERASVRGSGSELVKKSKEKYHR